MGRSGIKETDVFHCANELLSMGTIPTPDRIRKFLGTGSLTTICSHLKNWRSMNMPSEPSAKQLPDSLVVAINSFLEKSANEVRKQCEAQILDAKSDVADITKECARLEDSLSEALAKLDAVNTELAEWRGRHAERGAELELVRAEFAQILRQNEALEIALGAGTR